MQPKNDLLSRLTLIVKKIVYDPQRFKIFLKMLGTQQGALQAVHTVLAIIQKQTQVPEQLLPQLGVNAYLIMVDVAQQTTGHKADPMIVHQVVQAIMKSTTQPAAPSQPAPAPAQSAPAPQGIIGAQMGAQ